MGRLTLVLGGARSGKSAFAEELVREEEKKGRAPVYVATCAALPEDAEMALRIAKHRERRPPSWVTVEAPLNLKKALWEAPRKSTLLVDSLTLWVANVLAALPEGVDGEEETARRAEAFCQAVADAPCDVVAVSDEVGWGVVPSTPLGRLFRDALGRANQEFARGAHVVWLVVAGLSQKMK